MSSRTRRLGAPGFDYRAGLLHAEEVAVPRIAAAVGTPFYCYSSGAIEAEYRRFQRSFADQGAMICYAVKANANLAIIRTLARLGAGADVVSEGELRQALAAGIPAARIVFSGIGKTRAEMAFALEQGIHQLNVESEPELEALSEIAAATGRRAPVALRVNPDVDALTHAKITTGRKEDKFGIDAGRIAELASRARALPGIALEGLAVHIGSQLTELAPYRLAFSRLAELVGALRAAGIPVNRLDLGGGLGIAYRDEQPVATEDYAALVKDIFGRLGVALALEPGRALVGNAGILVASILYVKEGASRRFLILDAAMNDLIRPALYEAWHEIIPVREPPPGSPVAEIDVVGPVCESGDTFAQQRALPPLAPAELVAFLSAGAYGSVMGSGYNSRLLAPEVLVRGGEFRVIRKRPSYEELLCRDSLPEWLSG
jgi:diaminopimelate decarboxylase